MDPLARRLGARDYFTIGFGAMVGVGWLVVMDDWLSRGGPLGAVLGFGLGGLALMPIGYIYGKLAAAHPDAGAEITYAERGFGPRAGFVAGWMMMLAYLIVCPWEAVAIGKLLAWIFPAMSTMELYKVAGKPVYLPHLAVGLGLTALLTILNYRSLRSSAALQNIATFGLLGLFVVLAACGFSRGSAANLQPLFAAPGAIGSTLLVLQVVPYFMSGFEAVPKCAEEAHLKFEPRGFGRVMLLAILVGTVFYAGIVAIAAYAAPWQELTKTRFATAVALERALGARWIVEVVLLAALLSLVKVFNGNFMAASRMLFALGRRGFVSARLGQVHPGNRTPYIAVVGVGLWTLGGALLGEAILIPVTEVGSLVCAVGWLFACGAFFRFERGAGQRALSIAGMLVAGAMVLMKLLPFVPGAFTRLEFAALGAWIAAGVWAGRGLFRRAQALTTSR